MHGNDLLAPRDRQGRVGPCGCAPGLIAKYLTMPQQVAAGSQMTLGSPAAVTDMRAFGAIFLGLAIACLWSLLSTRRLLSGLTLTAIVVGCVTAARLVGIALDGAAHESIFKLVPEVVLVSLSLVGIGIERLRRRYLADADDRRRAPDDLLSDLRRLRSAHAA